MSLSTTFRAASPLTFAGNSTPRSSRCEAAERMTSWVSVSLAIGILRSLVQRHAPPPPKPHFGRAAGGAGSRSAPGARNGHSTAPFADECQSFLDNVMAGLGRIGAWNDPTADPAAAARGGLGSAPDRRTRRALLHLSYSCASPVLMTMLVRRSPRVRWLARS